MYSCSVAVLNSTENSLDKSFVVFVGLLPSYQDCVNTGTSSHVLTDCLELNYMVLGFISSDVMFMPGLVAIVLPVLKLKNISHADNTVSH